MARPVGFSGRKATICALPSSVRLRVNVLEVCACDVIMADALSRTVMQHVKNLFVIIVLINVYRKWVQM